LPSIGSFVAQRMPPRIKPTARRIYHLPEDVLNFVLGRRDPLTPPKGKVFFGGGPFEEIGEEFLRHFIELGNLKPDERVLDLGCGIGRMAVPLTSYLGDRGSYEGFDVYPKGISWCQENITSRYPNFRFRVADIRNKEYNPGGRFAASEYELPYNEASFDFVFLTSVFTHLLPNEVDNYLSEIRRVLAPGGRCLATFFLLNEESLDLLCSGSSTIDFKHDFGEYRTKNASTLEAAVAYPESFIRNLYSRHGLSIADPIRYGSWPGRTDFLTYQDIVVALREAAP
jgi:ubiquinone/menaquinone biosynthesis C-methylase UbiE